MESGMAYLSYVAQRDNQPIFVQLDDDDIDTIQAILDESDNDDDEVVFVDQNHEFPWPRKG